jgi:hypothetical protein
MASLGSGHVIMKNHHSRNFIHQEMAKRQGKTDLALLLRDKFCTSGGYYSLVEIIWSLTRKDPFPYTAIGFAD